MCAGGKKALPCRGERLFAIYQVIAVIAAETPRAVFCHRAAEALRNAACRTSIGINKSDAQFLAARTANNIQPSVSRIFSMAAARLSQPSFK